MYNVSKWKATFYCAVSLVNALNYNRKHENKQVYSSRQCVDVIPRL